MKLLNAKPLFHRLKTPINRAATLIAALCLAASVQAAEIALLDQNYVLFNSIAAEEATVELKREFAEEEQQVQTLEQSIQQLQSKARTDGDIMTDEEKAELEADLQQRLQNRQRLVQQLQQVQSERRNAFIRQHQPLIAQAIENTIGEDQFDIILDKGAVIYHRNSLDITDAVLKEFDELYQAQQQ